MRVVACNDNFYYFFCVLINMTLLITDKQTLYLTNQLSARQLQDYKSNVADIVSRLQLSFNENLFYFLCFEQCIQFLFVNSLCIHGILVVYLFYAKNIVRKTFYLNLKVMKCGSCRHCRGTNQTTVSRILLLYANNSLQLLLCKDIDLSRIKVDTIDFQIVLC